MQTDWLFDAFILPTGIMNMVQFGRESNVSLLAKSILREL